MMLGRDAASPRPAAVLRRALDERGVALPLALVVLLILAALAVALADLTAAELDTGRWTRWDVQAQYLAQAGIEHQIYALKANKNAVGVGSVNYPLTPGQEYWYSVASSCLAAQSAGDPAISCSPTTDRESRRWRIVATGEIREPGSPTVLQTRAIRADVEIAYGWGTANGITGFVLPTTVTILRWEEVYP